MIDIDIIKIDIYSKLFTYLHFLFIMSGFTKALHNHNMLLTNCHPFTFLYLQVLVF